VEEEAKPGAIPAYLLDREQTSRAKVLSNTIKQKRKEKAGKWEVPLPKVRRCRLTLSKPSFKPPKTNRLKLKSDELLSNLGFSFHLRPYTKVRPVAEDEMFRVMRSGRGLHSPTSQLNVSRLCHSTH